MEMIEAAAFNERAKKKAIRRVIVAFVLVMAGLTFFSNTLINISLPQVTVEKAAPGTLSHEVTGSGTVEPAETADLYVTVNWAVSEAAVQVGDKVAAGQSLVAFQTQDAENKLRDDQARYEQKQLSMQKLQDSYMAAARSGDESQLRGIARDIESAKLDLQIQERAIVNTQRQLADFTRLASPVSGIVTEVNAVKGAPVQAGKAAVRVADLSKGQLLKAAVPNVKAQYVNVGDETELVFTALNNARIKAKVTEMRDVAASQGSSASSSGQSGNVQDQKKISFALHDDRLKGGETGEFDIVKTSAPYPLVLSNDAIREDSNGKYVLVMKEKKGPLGSEYVLQRASVQVGDADDKKTVIVSGVTPIDKVVVSSNKSVADGDRVIQTAS